jgi:hypothetical protein
MSAWQPIETAPQDEEFLVWHRQQIRQVRLYKALGDVVPHNTVIDPWAGRMWVATHWMPLPDPPVSS